MTVVSNSHSEAPLSAKQARQEIVQPTEWLEARKTLLAKEKELTKTRDALAQERKALPMVELAKPYTLTAADGSPKTLLDLFEGRRQLVVYHFMLAPGSQVPCHGCSFATDQFPAHLEHLHSRQTTFVLVSRAPIEEINAVKRRMGWQFPWYSSYESDFNYDLCVDSTSYGVCGRRTDMSAATSPWTRPRRPCTTTSRPRPS